MPALLFKTKTSVVWMGLILATVLSWQVGTHGSDPEIATCMVMAIAFVKIRFVGSWFMELRHAPTPLRLLFDTYVVVVGLSVIVLYLVL